MFQKEAEDKIRTQTNTIFNNVCSKVAPFMRYLEKYCIAG